MTASILLVLLLLLVLDADAPLTLMTTKPMITTLQGCLMVLAFIDAL
ncbi:MAG: hypothetical protein ACKVY0_13070 [Prosthecobacter sp.]